MAKVEILNQRLPHYYYEIGLLTKTDNKNSQLKFIIDKKLVDSEIKEIIEKISNVWVESIKIVTKYKRKYHDEAPQGNGAVITAEYKIDGSKVKTNSLYLPDLRSGYAKNYKNIQKELKILFGAEFEIVSFMPR